MSIWIRSFFQFFMTYFLVSGAYAYDENHDYENYDKYHDYCDYRECGEYGDYDFLSQLPSWSILVA